MANPLPLILLAGGAFFLLRKDGAADEGPYTGPLDTAHQRQAALAAIGVYGGELDGVWNARTQSALEGFQKANRWVATGNWSAEVEEAVRSLLPPDWSPPPIGTDITPKHKAGSSGYEKVSINEMKEVQRGLRDAGHDPGVIDGTLNDETKKAVSDFQKDKGLPQTGLPDVETREEAREAAQPVTLVPAMRVATINDSPQARPPTSTKDVKSGREGGLEWKVWSQPDGGPYHSWWHAIRNPQGKLVAYGSHSSYDINLPQEKQDALDNEMARLADNIARALVPPATEANALKLPPILSWQTGFNANLTDYVIGTRWRDATLDAWLDSRRRMGWLATKYEEVSPWRFLSANPDFAIVDMFRRIDISSDVLSTANYAQRAGSLVKKTVARVGIPLIATPAGIVAAGLVTAYGVGMIREKLAIQQKKLLEASAATNLKKFIEGHHVEVHGADGPMKIGELPQTPAVLQFIDDIAYYIARFQSSEFST